MARYGPSRRKQRTALRDGSGRRIWSSRLKRVSLGRTGQGGGAARTAGHGRCSDTPSPQSETPRPLGRAVQQIDRAAPVARYDPVLHTSALHWVVRQRPPPPSAALARTVHSSDYLAWATASSKRASCKEGRGEYREAFHGYVIALELLDRMLADEDATWALQSRGRKLMESVLRRSERLKQSQPQLLLMAPTRPPEVAIGRAWAAESTADSGSIQRQADDSNAQGNAAFRDADYASAVECFSHALDLAGDDAVHTAQYCGNRAVASLALGDLRQAVLDGRRAVDGDPEAVAARSGAPRQCLTPPYLQAPSPIRTTILVGGECAQMTVLAMARCAYPPRGRRSGSSSSRGR